MNSEANIALLNYELISTLLHSLQAAMAHTEHNFSHKTDLFPIHSGTHVFVFEPTSSL
jgi:hypothetical protein